MVTTFPGRSSSGSGGGGSSSSSSRGDGADSGD